MERKSSSETGICTKLGRILCRELSPKWFGFNGVHPRSFATPQIDFPFQPVSWIIWRFFLAFYASLWLALTLWKWGTKPAYPQGTDTKAKFFVYASNWSYIGLCVYLLCSAMSTLVYHMSTAFTECSPQINKERQSICNSIECGEADTCRQDTLPWHMKFTWWLQSSVFVFIALTSFLRWASDSGEPFQYATSVYDIHIHGVGLFLAILDVLLIASPYRLQHVVYPMLFALLYCLFTLLYYFAGGTNHHHIDKDIDGDTYLYRHKFDWGRYPITSVFMLVIMVFVGVPIVHTIYYFLFKLREICVEWYYYSKRY